jgi:hypothetical protein
MSDAGLKDKARDLLRNALSVEATSLTPCSEGGNNRGLIADTPKGRFFVKSYFQAASDKRSRLRTEWDFLTCATALGLEATPRPVASDPIGGIGIYEFVEGRKLIPVEINDNAVMAAARFLKALNSPKARQAAVGLPPASEACFSIASHLDLIEHRLARLSEAVASHGQSDPDAARFIVNLRNTWNNIKQNIRERAGPEFESDLPIALRCVSPSDFGFHNALRRPDGRLCFIDFEYAGWDDPAKTVADFFCQPALPVNARYLERFATEFFSVFPNPDFLSERTLLLRPIFQIKWCCIMLNIFIPENAERILFARPDLNETDHKQQQLDKAASALKRAKECA